MKSWYFEVFPENHINPLVHLNNRCSFTISIVIESLLRLELIASANFHDYQSNRESTDVKSNDLCPSRCLWKSKPWGISPYNSAAGRWTQLDSTHFASRSKSDCCMCCLSYFDEFWHREICFVSLHAICHMGPRNVSWDSSHLAWWKNQETWNLPWWKWNLHQSKWWHHMEESSGVVSRIYWYCFLWVFAASIPKNSAWSYDWNDRAWRSNGLKLSFRRSEHFRLCCAYNWGAGAHFMWMAASGRMAWQPLCIFGSELFDERNDRHPQSLRIWTTRHRWYLDWHRCSNSRGLLGRWLSDVGNNLVGLRGSGNFRWVGFCKRC